MLRGDRHRERNDRFERSVSDGVHNRLIDHAASDAGVQGIDALRAGRVDEPDQSNDTECGGGDD